MPNGARYLVGERKELEEWCKENRINPDWIREKRGRYYLRLWGRYKGRGRQAA